MRTTAPPLSPVATAAGQESGAGVEQCERLGRRGSMRWQLVTATEAGSCRQDPPRRSPTGHAAMVSSRRELAFASRLNTLPPCGADSAAVAVVGGTGRRVTSLRGRRHAAGCSHSHACVWLLQRCATNPSCQLRTPLPRGTAGSLRPLSLEAAHPMVAVAVTAEVLCSRWTLRQ